MGRGRAASQSLHRHQTLESERGLECPDLFAIGAQTRVLVCAYDPTRLDCGLGRVDRILGVSLSPRRPRTDGRRAALPARKYHAAIEREIHSGVQSAGHRHVAFAGN